MAKILKDKTGTWYGGDVPLSADQSKTNARCVAKFCKSMATLNWTKESCCAMLGNMWRESHVNPQWNQVGGSGYGLTQWTPKDKLIKQAKKIKQYKSYDMMYTQLCVIDYESTHNEQWINRGSHYMSWKDFAENRQNKSLDYLVETFLRCYEGAGTEALNERIQYAHMYSDYINWEHISSDDGRSIDDFLEWCKEIADNNEYRYIWGANHSAPPWTINPKGFDCSSFICYGLKLGGGYDLPSVFPTSTMKNGLTNLGFEAMPFKRSQLKRGDIVLIEGEHVEAIYSVGDDIKIVGAHASEIHGVPVPVADQISVKSLGDDTYQWILRPFDSPSSKPREYPTNSNKSSRKVNPKTPSPNTQNALPPTFLKRKRRF